MNIVVIGPVLVALLAGTTALLVAPRAQRGILVAGALGHFLIGLALFARVHEHGVQAYQVGGWHAPLGIAVVADHFAAVLVLLTGLLGLAVALQVARFTPREEIERGAPALVFFLLAGVDAAFLTADLFHLYVAFEVLLLASFVLLILGGRAEQRVAAVRYLVPGVLSSMLLLAGVGLMYGLTGTLLMTEAADRVAELGSSAAVQSVAGLLALAFALKAAVFPVFAWLPASYPAAPSAVVALFSGLLTKVGVYALVRVFTLVLPAELAWLGPMLLFVAGATMVVGVLGALAQWGMQRLLSFHVVSQVGYLVIGLGLGTSAGLASAVFYLFHNSVAKACLLLATGVVKHRRGTDRLRSLGGLANTDPWLAGLFLVAALALAGIPPLSGFWAKLLVLRAAIDSSSWTIVVIAAGVGVFTLLSMAKIWTSAFWGSVPAAQQDRVEGRLQTESPASKLDLIPVALLVVVVVALGLLAGPAIQVAERAASELLDSTAYVEALNQESP